jgi:uncharacterized cupredoxin-like copper-binding protein
MRTAHLATLPLLLIAASAAPAQAPSTIEVHLSNFKFTPSTIVLRQGQPYVLRLVNDSGGGHDFTAREFFASATIAPGDRALVEEGEVELSGRQVREVHLTATRPGSYKLRCTHSFHKALGMSGRIVVR